VRRTAQYLVASPNVLAPGMDPRKLKDKFSSSYLIALASRMAQEVGQQQAGLGFGGKFPAVERQRHARSLVAAHPAHHASPFLAAAITCGPRLRNKSRRSAADACKSS